MTKTQDTSNKRRTFGMILLLGAVFFAAGLALPRRLQASPTDGQEGEHMGMMEDCPMMQDDSMMGSCPMMGAASEGPEAALEHREDLELTDAQVDELELLDANLDQTQEQAAERMKSLNEQIAQTTSAKQFDEGAVRQAYDEMGAQHTELGVAMLRAKHQVGQVLSPEQQAVFADVAQGSMAGMEMCMKMMHGDMQGQSGMKNMEDCPMMDGGKDNHSQQMDKQ